LINGVTRAGWHSRISELSVAGEESEEYVGERVVCLLNTEAAVLDAIGQTQALGLISSLTNVAYSFESCEAEAEGEVEEGPTCSLCFAPGSRSTRTMAMCLSRMSRWATRFWRRVSRPAGTNIAL
jgi:hypothetical protein